MNLTQYGRAGISATVIKDSISRSGNRLLTYELVYPRIILAEANTHCMLEKNSSSSRAVPVEAAMKLIEESPAMPVEWGSNNSGMVSNEPLSELQRDAAIALWKEAAKSAVSFARVMSDKGGINAHKQIANRIAEPFTFMKTVMSGTEWENFFWLRDHPDADPTFRELAATMNIARAKSTPTLLQPNEWHVPYVEYQNGKYWASSNEEISLDVALKVSSSCCAQASYRKLDDSVEKAVRVFDMLNIGSETKPAHASPLTHQGTPMENFDGSVIGNWPHGVTHLRRDGSYWSGKFQGWIQHRQLISNEAKW